MRDVVVSCTERYPEPPHIPPPVDEKVSLFGEFIIHNAESGDGGKCNPYMAYRVLFELVQLGPLPCSTDPYFRATSSVAGMCLAGRGQTA